MIGSACPVGSSALMPKLEPLTIRLWVEINIPCHFGAELRKTAKSTNTGSCVLGVQRLCVDVRIVAFYLGESSLFYAFQNIFVVTIISGDKVHIYV
jgi:hypothetical protein